MPSLEVDGTVRQEEVSLAEKPVSPQYFQTLGIPIRAGRSFVDGEPYEHVILDEKFARQFWPDGAVGHTFRGDFSRQVRTIIGVAGHVRTDGVRRDEPFFFYTPPPPPQVVQAAAPQSGGGRVSGGWWGLLQLAIRLDSPERADEVLRAARAMAPQFQMKAGLVDESYAGYEKDILLVSRTVSAFGVVAFVVAMTGIYGVMAFIVAGRRREIGIRMALGADRRAISRLVIGSSLRLTLIGVGVGLVAALAASRFIQSHLFGITSTDPSTYGLVGVLIAATAIVATWHPARQACRVDPAVTLRAE
jgi:hypothetical protein